MIPPTPVNIWEKGSYFDDQVDAKLLGRGYLVKESRKSGHPQLGPVQYVIIEDVILEPRTRFLQDVSNMLSGEHYEMPDLFEVQVGASLYDGFHIEYTDDLDTSDNRNYVKEMMLVAVRG